MSPSRQRAAGRRRAPGRVRRFPDIRLRLTSGSVPKGLTTLAILVGLGGVLAAPSAPSAQATLLLGSPAPIGVPSGRADVLAARAGGGEVSRSDDRASGAAPLPILVLTAETFGVADVAAVPKRGVADAVSPTAYSPTGFAAAGAAIGLGPNAQRVYSAVRSAFGITTIGGFRAGDSGDHGSGHAVDVMISSSAQGDAVAAFARAHASELHIAYVIWSQHIWSVDRAGEGWRPMSNRGSATANHYDHVHISVY